MMQVTCKNCGRVHAPLRTVTEAGWDSVYVGWWLQPSGPGFRFITACECDEDLWSSNGVRRTIPSLHIYANVAFDFTPEVFA